MDSLGLKFILTGLCIIPFITSKRILVCVLSSHTNRHLPNNLLYIVGIHTRTWALYGCGYSDYRLTLFSSQDQQNQQPQVRQKPHCYVHILFNGFFQSRCCY